MDTRKKQLVIFGGSGGLGSKVADLLQDKYEVTPLSSSDCDITSLPECQAFFRNRIADIVLNFAGFNADKMIHKIDAVDAGNLGEMIDVNIKGAVNISAACLPGMRERKYGRIVMISSILACMNVPGAGVYSATKSFIDRFVKSVSSENIREGITCNSIQLGYFDAGMTYKLPNPAAVKESLPLKRFGMIEELAGAIEFFINTEYCTGINLPLTGGL